MSRDKTFLNSLTVGDIVVYKMLPKDLPVDPDREWRGKILQVPCLDCFYVESLEEDTRGLTEWVYLQQIVRKVY